MATITQAHLDKNTWLGLPQLLRLFGCESEQQLLERHPKLQGMAEQIGNERQWNKAKVLVLLPNRNQRAASVATAFGVSAVELATVVADAVTQGIREAESGADEEVEVLRQHEVEELLGSRVDDESVRQHLERTAFLFEGGWAWKRSDVEQLVSGH